MVKVNIMNIKMYKLLGFKFENYDKNLIFIVLFILIYL